MGETPELTPAPPSGICPRVGRRPKQPSREWLNPLIFECLRWGPCRPCDILLVSGRDKKRRKKIAERLQKLEKQGILYSTRSKTGGLGGARAVFYDLDYAERVRRHGKTEPWTVAR